MGIVSEFTQWKVVWGNLCAFILIKIEA